MKRALLTVALLAVALAAGLPLALAQGSPVYITTSRLSLSEDTKYPHIAAQGGTVFVSSNAERSVARLWSKAETALAFGAPVTMGAAEGKPDNASTSVFVTPSGTVHYAWINQVERRVYLRTRAAGAASFGPAVVVTGAVPDPVEVEVAANEDGVFVFWRVPNAPISYRRSPDGVSWNVPILNLVADAALPVFDVAAGPGRRLAVAYYRGRVENDKDYLQSYLAVWNGGGFVNERIPAQVTRDFANPRVALRPDGGFAVAMTNPAQLSGEGAGVYVADRSPSGAWSGVARLARGETFSVDLETDPLGNLHLFYVNTFAGTIDLYYTYRRVGQGYGGSPPAGSAESPLRVVVGTPQNSRLITNVRAAASLSDRSYGHAVGELFSGDVPFVQYYLFGLPVTSVGASSVSIEGGARATSKSTVSVAFAGLTGAPDGVRWSWGAPPAAGAPYSPFNPASPTIAVPVPPAANANCAPLTLYTQLRAGAVEQQTPSSDTILLDRAVQAEYFVSGVPPALDPRYTPTLSASVTIYSAGDCAGLAAAAVSGPVPGGALSLPVAGRPLYQQTVALTGDPATPGVKPLAFVASDLVGNSTPAPITRTVIYDPVAPTLRGAAAEVPATLTPYPSGTSQLTLALDRFDATDVGGVVAGIEIAATGPASGGAAPAGRPLRIPFSQADRVTTNPDGTLNLRATFSLLELFTPAQLAPGTYSFEVRALDGAGNASAERLALTESLTTLTFPAWAPLLRR